MPVHTHSAPFHVKGLRTLPVMAMTSALYDAWMSPPQIFLLTPPHASREGLTATVSRSLGDGSAFFSSDCTALLRSLMSSPVNLIRSTVPVNPGRCRTKLPPLK